MICRLSIIILCCKLHVLQLFDNSALPITSLMITLLSWYELKMIPIKFHRLICHIIPKYFQSISDYIESFEVEAVNGCIRVVFEDVANNIMASPDKTIFLKIQVVLMQVGFLEDEVNRNNTVRSGIVGKSGDDDTNN